MQGGSPFLSTLAPSEGERRIAIAVLLLSAAVFLAAAPFAKVPLPQIPAFLPVYQSGLIVSEVITAVLLLGQYRILRSRSLLILACGYLFSAMMAAAHALSFPGLFAPGGLLGARPQTTAWLYFLWHGGFPLFVIGYAFFKNDPSTARLDKTHPGLSILAVVVVAAVLTSAMTLLAGVGQAALPPLMSGNTDAPAKVVVATATWMIALAALMVMWWKRPHSILDLWLMIVLCVWIFDTALAAVLNHARYDVGWYAGRIYGFLAGSFVLLVLLLENSMLYARLAQSRDALESTVAQLEAANRDLNVFAGGVAHDLQQPIATIGAFAQLIQKNNSHVLSEDDVRHLTRIIMAAQHADQMIHSLLEFARLGEKELDLVQVDLNPVVDEARAVLSDDGAGPTTAWKVAPLPVVRGDPALLVLAFANLLSNAVKYSRTRRQPSIEIDSHFEEGKGHAIRVRDNGVGFDMAHAKRLFDPFERLHHAHEFQGTGMGLANVRRIMERHGGSVQAQSQPGQGATFTLLFRTR